MRTLVLLSALFVLLGAGLYLAPGLRPLRKKLGLFGFLLLLAGAITLVGSLLSLTAPR